MVDYSCHNIRRAGHWSGNFDLCVLTYDERFLRRKVIKTAHGETLLVDLEHTTSVENGDAFELTDGRVIECIAADEDLYKITGDLVRLVWHIGNRHTPCQMAPDHVLIQRNHVMKGMLEKLGAGIEEVHWPFTPEGGAYGHGRTHGHAH
ncbi:urease accessory protein UreE [Octadecabacter sp. G9-8]|uniref:Urease accessory protein UreE n=1 Tax=Octadecabacter dasysiphoniae TaxID=2909341 RepID=A0ABS9CYX4_9RHOB|nr:urease accessory protein UreE [Octadecabacter dasysiphoniae]MCF2872389.1 urease accessory protein UreE [Octadecabacter dasysiphoniae]